MVWPQSTTIGLESISAVSSPVTVDLKEMFWLDAQRGWIAGHDRIEEEDPYTEEIVVTYENAVVLRTSDGGQTWHLASLQTPVMPICHTRFRFPWVWDGNPALIASRCVDETGYVQPTTEQINAVRGVNGHAKYASIYHNNGIQAWGIESDGSVVNAAHQV